MAPPRGRSRRTSAHAAGNRGRCTRRAGPAGVATAPLPAPSPPPQAAQLPAPAGTLRAALLGFYDLRRRDLPWRRTRDPWAILVSEVMLQQTTVAAVIPYYERFLRRWPKPAALARASRRQLLSEWAGLGYYRRAENLHRAASAVAASGGRLPRRRDDLARLPGIGEYTSAAVASIAYGEPVAAVDGNVERVLGRLCAIPGDLRAAAGRQAIRLAAADLLDRDRPGDANQALMELGATVCRPVAPRCGTCPLAPHCRALGSGRAEDFPHRAARRTPVAVTTAAIVVQRRGRVLLRRRAAPPNAGFLELPSVELPTVDRPAGRAQPATRSGGAPAESSALALGILRRRLGDHLRREHGLRVTLGEPLPELRHTITHHRIRVRPFLGALAAGRVREPLHWSDPAEADLPITTATRRILLSARNSP